MLTPGSVSRTLPLPGILEQAKGFKNIAEALYLRDHLLSQLELADASDDPAQRQARCTFVVVGAGYTGTEMAAQGPGQGRGPQHRRHPRPPNRQPYKHRDLGFVVDLSGWQAVANPLHLPLSGALAKIITRGYHLYALPANRLRVATDWFNDIIEHRQFVQLGLIPSEYSGLTAAEHTEIYYQTDGRPLSRQRQESAR